MRLLRLLLACGLAALVVAATAAAGALTLHPSGFGERSYAAWKAKEGLPDSHGGARQALYLQKMTATATFAAAVAIVEGVQGMPVSALTGLSWEHRMDGHCGAGAPRWNVVTTDALGQFRVVFLGCAAAVHTPGSAPGWMRDSYPGPAIAAQVAAQAPGATTLVALGIVFDEGNDVGQGYVHLDNITVNDQVWTSASDNGNG